MLGCFVADTEAEARKSYEHFLWRVQKSIKGPLHYYVPAGMSSRAGRSLLQEGAGGQGRKSIFNMSIDELVEAGGFFVGGAQGVGQRLQGNFKRLGNGPLPLYGPKNAPPPPERDRRI